MYEHLQRIKGAPLWVLGLFFAGHLALNALFNLTDTGSALLGSVYRATNGLLNNTLLYNLFMIALLIGLIVMGLGRLRPRDLGVFWRKLLPAVLLMALAWLMLQGVLALLALSEGQTVQVHPRWAQVGAAAVIGTLIGQVFGNALFEELAYRGFVLPQLFHHFRFLSNRHVRLALALLLSMVLFALIHIPARLAQGVAIEDMLGSLAWTGMLGLFFAFFYLRTGAIWWAVAVHAIGNAPTLAVAVNPGVDPSFIMAMINLGLLVVSLVWKPFGRFVNADGRAPVSTATEQPVVSAA